MQIIMIMLQNRLTPLHLAVKKSSAQVTRALISAGVDVNSQDIVSPQMCVTNITVQAVLIM